ncbi:cell division protein DivIVA, partial [Streptococcus agalactiae 515]
VDDYEDLIRRNREQEQYIKDLEEKIAYFNEMKESLSQSVILEIITYMKLLLKSNSKYSY